MEDAVIIKSVAIEKLVSYGKDNPRASDTAEGIAKWWIQMPLEVVLPALESLVELGIWKKLKRDDRVLYCPVYSPDLYENTGSTGENQFPGSFDQ